VEEITIKAARTAKRVWWKCLAQNIFSKPEKHWKAKLEAELHDMEQDKVQDGTVATINKLFHTLQPSKNYFKSQPLLTCRFKIQTKQSQQLSKHPVLFDCTINFF